MVEGILFVVGHKAGEGGEEEIGRGFAIDPLDDGGAVEVRILFESGTQIVRHFLAQIGLYQQFADIGTASFIAEHKAERGSLMHDIGAIVEAGAGARTEDSDERFSTRRQ